VLGVAALIAALVALLAGVPAVGLWCVGAGVVLLVVALRERERYEALTVDEPPAPSAVDHLGPTDEVFADPTTGERMRVWFDPDTGRRVYRAETNSRR
jgi:hypothetical protein